MHRQPCSATGEARILRIRRIMVLHAVPKQAPQLPVQPSQSNAQRTGQTRAAVASPVANNGPVQASSTEASSSSHRSSHLSMSSMDSVDSMESVNYDESLDGQPPPTTTSQPRAARILQGTASVRGLLKHENQDRVTTGHKVTASARTDETAESRGQQDEASTTDRPERQVLYSAVYDGHGGSLSATYAAQRLQYILQGEQALLSALDTLHDHGPSMNWDAGQDSHFQGLWSRVFDSMDDEILDQSRASGKVDGTTALVGVHAGSSLVVANAGDCRAVLGRGGHALRLTSDHKPSDHAERARIEAAGGTVRHLKGSWRVLLPNRENTEVKICATSRGLGDLDFKEKHLLTCQPQLTHVSLLPHVDKFSIFATDGLWAHVEDQDAVDKVTAVFDQFARMSRPDLKVAATAAAHALVKLALDRGSVDDISVIIHAYEWDDQPAA